MLITGFGVAAVTTMIVAYGLESRSRTWTAVFAAGCLATAGYGVIIGAWIFAALETVWAVVALNRFRTRGNPRDAIGLESPGRGDVGGKAG